MKNSFLKENKKGQSILEYSVIFAIAVGILIVAINGPLRNSLTTVFTNLINDIQTSIQNLTGLIHYSLFYF
jgi:Flp pilus assembly pilin Flp